MPYIKKINRQYFEEALRKLEPKVGMLTSVGELNYLFTRLALSYVKGKGKKYSVINDVLGAMEGAKLEFYRRTAAPYEDEKIKENGDVT